MISTIKTTTPEKKSQRNRISALPTGNGLCRNIGPDLSGSLGTGDRGPCSSGFECGPRSEDGGPDLGDRRGRGVRSGPNSLGDESGPILQCCPINHSLILCNMVNAADNRAAGRLFCIKLFEIFDQAQGHERAVVISAITGP
jgi:hypothetical protein